MGIDWGYAYLAADAGQTTSSIGGDGAETAAFIGHGALTNTDDANVPRAVNDNTLRPRGVAGHHGERQRWPGR